MGVLELRGAEGRGGRFSTELFERYHRSETAWVAALAEMYVQGVSTRKVKAITEELCGYGCSASAISDATARLDARVAIFLSNAIAFLFLPAFILYMNRFQIEPEERALTSLFGQEFVAYRSRVR